MHITNFISMLLNLYVNDYALSLHTKQAKLGLFHNPNLNAGLITCNILYNLLYFTYRYVIMVLSVH